MIEVLIRRTINPKYKFTQSDFVAMRLEQGLNKLLPKLFAMSDLDDERIIDYLVYQIYLRRTAIEEGKWTPSWLFSDFALAKYKKQFIDEDGKSGMNYYIDKWLDEYELSRGELLKMIAKPKPSRLRSMVYMENEEQIKQRFLNTPEGLALCQQSTTGWSPLSATCGKCNNWVDCGKITAKKYPELMRFRKEVYGNQKK